MTDHSLREYTPAIGNQYRAHMGNLARILSGEMEGVGRAVKRLEISPSSPCATDGDTVFLSYPIFPSVTDERMNIICTEAVLAHEAAGHLRYTNFNAWKRVTDGIKKGHEDKLLHDFVNIFEDARVNHLLGQDFGGSKKRLDFAQSAIMASHREKIMASEEGITDGQAPKMAVLAIATEAIMNEGHWFDHDAIINMMNDARPLFATAIAGRDTSEVIKGARAVLAVYRTHFPEDETGGKEYGASDSPEGEGIFADDMSIESIEEAANSQKREGQSAEKVERKRFKKIEVPTEDNTGNGEGEGDGESEEGEGAGDGEGDGEGEGEGQDGDSGDGEGQDGSDGEGEGGEGEGEGEGDGEGQDGSDGAGQATPSDSDKEGAGTIIKAGDNHFDGLLSGGDMKGGLEDADAFSGIDYAENLLAEAKDIMGTMDDMLFDEEGEWTNAIADTGEMWTDGGHGVQVGKNPMWREGQLADSTYYSETANANRGGINRMAQQIKNLVKGADSRFSTHHKRGKLDTRRLYAHTSSERLFRKAKVLPQFNLNCLILIDASGSMGCGTRAENAAKAAVTLAEAMEKVGANYEIVDFNSSNGAVSDYTCGMTYINVRKPFGESLSTTMKQQIVTPFAGSQNSDGWAVQWAIERVMEQDTDGMAKSMVFIISDGSPAGPSPHGVSANSHLRQVLAKAEKQEVILFSVGIDGMDTGKFYGNHGYAVVGNSDTLAQDIIVPLKKALKKAIKA